MSTDTTLQRLSPDALEAVLCMLYVLFVCAGPLIIALNQGPWWLWHLPFAVSLTALCFLRPIYQWVGDLMSQYQQARLGRPYSDGGGTTLIVVIGGAATSGLMVLVLNLMILFPVQ